MVYAQVAYNRNSKAFNVSQAKPQPNLTKKGINRLSKARDKWSGLFHKKT